MGEPSRQTPNATLQVAGLVGACFVALNIAFFFLSMIYFDGKHQGNGLPYDDAHINGVRIAFAVFTGIVSAAAIGTSMFPKLSGHGISAVTGALSLIAAYFAFRKGMPAVLPAALLVLGVLYPVLVWRSLEHSRGAWAFLISMCGVLAIVLLFGAPKVRGVLDIGLWTALIMPGLLAVATVGLAMLRVDYRERT